VSGSVRNPANPSFALSWRCGTSTGSFPSPSQGKLCSLLSPWAKDPLLSHLYPTGFLMRVPERNDGSQLTLSTGSKMSQGGGNRSP
jgi:hypothetical protein